MNALASDVRHPGELGLYTVLRRAAEDRLSDDEAFHFVEKHARAALRQIVLRLYHNVQRALTRATEQKVDAALKIAKTPSDRVSARRFLAEDTFVIPGGVVVRWPDATAEQHDARAAWQERLGGECLADAARHRQAAAEIRKAGVRCLRDLARKEKVRR